MAKATYSQETVDTKLPRLTAWRYTGNAILTRNQVSVDDDSVTFVSGFVKQYAEVGDIVYFYDANDSVLYAIGQVTEVRANQPTITVLGRNALLNNGLTFNSDGQMEVKPDYETLNFNGTTLIAVGQPDYDPEDTRPISGEGVSQAIKNDPTFTTVVTDISGEQTGTFNYNSADNSTPAPYVTLEDGALTVDVAANTLTVDFTKVTTRSQISSTYSICASNKKWKSDENHSAGSLGLSGDTVTLVPWELFQVSQTYNSMGAVSTIYTTGATATWDDATKTMVCTPDIPIARLGPVILSFGQTSGTPITYETNIVSIKVEGSTDEAPSVEFVNSTFATKDELPDAEPGLLPYEGNEEYTFTTAADMKAFIENELNFHIFNGSSNFAMTINYTGESESANVSIYLKHIKNINLKIRMRGAGSANLAFYIVGCQGGLNSYGAVTLDGATDASVTTVRSVTVYDSSVYINNVSTSGNITLYRSFAYIYPSSTSKAYTYGNLGLNAGSFCGICRNTSFNSLANNQTNGSTLNINDDWTGTFTTAPAADNQTVIRDHRTDHPLETYARRVT
jgi:hypothetical protein